MGLLALLLATLGLGAACSGDDGPDADAVNFTGTGTASLELDGTSRTFTVACETTDPSGVATLLVSGAGDDPEGGPLGLEVRIDQASQRAEVGANRAPGDPEIARATDAEVAVDDDRIVITGSFADEATGDPIGDGTVVVEGCTPG